MQLCEENLGKLDASGSGQGLHGNELDTSFILQYTVSSACSIGDLNSKDACILMN